MMIRDELAKLGRRTGAEVKATPDQQQTRHGSPWKWACVAASVVLAALLLSTLGASLWRAFVVAFLLACPVVVVVSAFTGVRPLPVPLGPVPATRGMTLNWLAPWYDWLWSLFGIGERFRNRVVELAALQPGEHVLDVGCGTGWFARHAVHAVGPSGVACGIDPAPDMIRIARQTDAPNGARFELAVIEALPFGDAIFDAIVASLVIHHLPPDVKAAGLAEVRRVLKEGGRLLVVEPDRPHRWLWRLLVRPLRLHPNLKCHIDGQTPDLVARAGFADLEVRDHWSPFVTMWTARKPGCASRPVSA